MTLKNELELPTFTGSQTIVLMLLVSFATVGALAISPALPSLTSSLGVSKHSAQLMITLYLVGFALGNLLYAPLANRHGRRPVIIACLAISSLTSFAGAAAGYLGSFSTLILSRLLMALSATGCLKISYNIAADVLKGHHLTRMNALFTTSLAITPPLSIAIGGYLTEHIGWESVCLFLGLYALLLIGLTLRIPETLKEKVMHAMHPKHIAQTYTMTLKGKFMILGSLIIGCSISSLYLFGTEAPFISENIIGLTPSQFGLLSLISYTGLLISGLFGATLSKRLKTTTILFLGLLIFFLASTLFFLLFLRGVVNAWSLFLPTSFIFFGMGLIFSAGITLTMSYASDKSYGSSLMNFINLTFSTLVVLLLGRLTLIHIITYPLLLIALSLFAILLSILIKRKLA